MGDPDSDDLIKNMKDSAFKIHKEWVREPASIQLLNDLAEVLKQEKEENLAMWIFATVEAQFFLGERLDRMERIVTYLTSEMSKQSKFEDKKSMR